MSGLCSIDCIIHRKNHAVTNNPIFCVWNIPNIPQNTATNPSRLLIYRTCIVPSDG